MALCQCVVCFHRDPVGSQKNSWICGLVLASIQFRWNPAGNNNQHFGKNIYCESPLVRLQLVITVVSGAQLWWLRWKVPPFKRGDPQWCLTVKTLREPCKFWRDGFRRSRNVSRFNLQAFVHGGQGLVSAFKIRRRYWSGTGRFRTERIKTSRFSSRRPWFQVTVLSPSRFLLAGLIHLVTMSNSMKEGRNVSFGVFLLSTAFNPISSVQNSSTVVLVTLLWLVYFGVGDGLEKISVKLMANYSWRRSWTFKSNLLHIPQWMPALHSIAAKLGLKSLIKTYLL